MTDPRLWLAPGTMADLGPLRRWVARAPDVGVETVQADIRPGELGAADTLTVLAGSGGALVVAIRTLPDFLRARRTNVTIKVKVGETTFEIDVKNAEDMVPLIEQLIERVWP
ncbi:MAG: hypothetical protein ABIS86_06230 [Streptosporangiaceae bacterium]